MVTLAKLFSTEKNPTLKSKFKPQLDCLERREVLSTSSASLHAITNAAGENVAVFLQSTAGQAPQLTVSTVILGNEAPINAKLPTDVPNTPNGVQALSVGLDAKGAADVFVKALDGSFWEYDGRWSKIQLPGTSQVQSFAAVNGGRVYAIFQDGSLNVLEPSGTALKAAPLLAGLPPVTPAPVWSHVYGAASVTTLDAVTDKYGHDAVFVENADKSFGRFYNPNSASVTVPAGQVYVGAYTQITNADHITIIYGGKLITTTFSQVATFSAGTDANGFADVFATWYTGDLYKFTDLTGWTLVAAAQTFDAYSATDSGMAWVAGTDGTLDRFNGSSLQAVFGVGGTVRSLAAANSDSVFATFTTNEIDAFEIDPTPNHLNQAITVGTTPD